MDEFNAKVLINRLKEYLQIKTDDALAKHLNLSASAISTWKARNTIDFQLIFAKCKGVDWNYLFTGLPCVYSSLAVGEPKEEYKATPISNTELLDIIEPYLLKIGRLEGQLDLLKEQMKSERINVGEIMIEKIRKSQEKEKTLKKPDLVIPKTTGRG